MRSNGRICWLWCCFTVFLAGCGHALISATPTQTLLSFSTPTFRPTAILRLLRTPTLRSSGTALAVIATPMAVTVEPPTCYETPVGSIWCFGLVRNLTSTAVEQVTIEVYLVTVNGNPLIQHDAHPAHTVILPDKESPYSVMFDSMPEQAVGSVSVLTNAIPASQETINRFANLSVSNVTYETRNGVYSGSVTLTNSDATPAQDISIVVTLLNDNRQVTGYWKQHVNQSLNAGQSQQFQFEAIPQGLSTKLVEVSAEAWH